MTKRLLEYGARLDGLVKSALEAERASDIDAARLAAIEAKLAAPPPPPPSSTRPWLYAAGAAVLVGIAVLSLRPSSPPPVVAPTPVPPTLVSVAPPAPPEPVALPTISPHDLPSAREPSPPSPSARPLSLASAPSPAPSATALPSETEEIALIARAQEALRSDPAASLALCREHAERFKDGHFTQEREAVAIEALVDLHRNEEARRALGAFVVRYPNSSHRAHLQDLLP